MESVQYLKINARGEVLAKITNSYYKKYKNNGCIKISGADAAAAYLKKTLNKSGDKFVIVKRTGKLYKRDSTRIYGEKNIDLYITQSSNRANRFTVIGMVLVVISLIAALVSTLILENGIYTLGVFGTVMFIAIVFAAIGCIIDNRHKKRLAVEAKARMIAMQNV